MQTDSTVPHGPTRDGTAPAGRVAGKDEARSTLRFADPAWTGNPLLRRVVQAYLATANAVEGLVQDVPMDWRDEERIS